MITKEQLIKIMADQYWQCSRAKSITGISYTHDELIEKYAEAIVFIMGKEEGST